MTNSQTISTLAIICFVGCSSLLHAQNNIIIDWEGNKSCNDFQYCNPERPNSSPTLTQDWVSGKTALEGNNSRQLTWSTQPGEFCGWVASFGPTGKSVVNFSAFSFQLKLVNCSDVFNIQLKDCRGDQITINGPTCYLLQCDPQIVTINLSRYNITSIDLTCLQEINFAFDSNRGCSPTGSIIIDEFLFVD